MFEVAVIEEAEADAPAPAVGQVLAFAESLSGGVDLLDDGQRVELIRALEVLKCAAEGVQVVATGDFDACQRAQAAAAGVPEDRQGRGVAHQIALARRVSPHRGQRATGLARVLVAEMPCTLAALRAGRITEWKATLLARETGCLSLADRRRVDQELAGDPQRIEQMGDGELAGKARALAAKLDPASVAERRRKAEADRTVRIRPAPETMTWLTGHLPVKQGVAVFAALKGEADRLIGTGDGRTRGQIMADTLVERVLGTATATEVPVTVNVVIDLDSLLGEADEAAEVAGYGPVPADAVREWIRDATAAAGRVELRRLFADPQTGQLVAMESRARDFPPALAQFIALRDRRCRTPWCDAPVRHTDHVVGYAAGGATSAGNGQGLCESCNYAKQAPGWTARPRPGPVHEVETTTPTGHTYRSRAPATKARRRLRVDLAWAA